ncbi:MAG TPA: C40 family peptidase [Cytophagaceae bacterium]
MNFNYSTYKFSKSLITQTIFLTCLAACLVSCKSNKQPSSSEPNKTVITPKEPQVGKANAKVEKVIKTARSYIGTKYKYGGSSRAGMDCSGLVYISFKEVGITLPRTSSAQSTAGKPVSLKDIQVGDLVFFTDRKGGKNVTHVGLVTEVRGKEDVKFIHASTKLGVVENNLYSEYYRALFIKAVRVI